MRRFRVLPLALLGLSLALAGCGTDRGERAVSGAGIGAAAGSIIGAVTGLSVLNGALIGAGIGGVTGALTDKSTLDIGDPVWKQSGGSGQTSSAGGSSALVADIQDELAQRGYDTGPADGILGSRTSAAIAAYQRDHGLLVDGRPSPELLGHIRGRTG